MTRLEQVLQQAAQQGWPVEQAHGLTWVTLSREAFKAQMGQFKEQGFNLLGNVVGLDYLSYPTPHPQRFGLVYELISLPGFAGGDGSRFFVRVYLPENQPHLPTVTDLWPGAGWLEREIFDLLGLVFDGHPDLRKILTPDDLEGHALRKDFPLGETPTLFKEGRFIDPAAFRAGLSGQSEGLTGWRGGSRKGYTDQAEGEPS